MSKPKPKAASAPWQNRIVGYGEEPPDQLLANPQNWRIHPKPQQDALSGVLHEVGIVQNVIVNKTTGHMVDGHLRVSLALREGQPTIPVTYVELSEAEEAEVLATLDPISAMAATDKVKLDELLRDVNSGSAAVQEMIGELAERSGIAEPGPIGDVAEGRYKEQYGVIVICESAERQEEVYNKLAEQGYNCKVVVT